MTAWDPGRYLRFADARYRPSLDLLARLEGVPGVIWDLGCGTGDITALLKARWPSAAVFGLDSSQEMLDRAGTHPDIEWVHGDIAAWDPGGAVDLILATASLHWVPDHGRLFPRLLGYLAPEGTLAVQMPRNFAEPSHTVLAELARSARWRDRIGHLAVESPVAEPSWYHGLLRPLATRVEVWETIYHQTLTGPDPVAEWMSGTAARPFLAVLGADSAAFLEDYSAAVRLHYPSSPDGTTLFPFRRLFIVARL